MKDKEEVEEAALHNLGGLSESGESCKACPERKTKGSMFCATKKIRI